MSTPMQYYNDLPPVSKTFVMICLLNSGANHLGLYNVHIIGLYYEDVVKRFQVWRLITNFFFLGPFSLSFAFLILLILRYGVHLERRAYDRRTADFLWMFIFGAFSLLPISIIIPFLWSPFMGSSLVFMIVYIWGREFPDVIIDIYGLFQLKGFYLPWNMIVLDIIFGNSLQPGLSGMMAGHLYYFLTTLYPLSSGRNILKTPLWVHKLVAFWGKGYQMNSPLGTQNASSGTAFQGRGRRLNETRSSRLNETRSSGSTQDQADIGVVFRGQGRRIGGP